MIHKSQLISMTNQVNALLEANGKTQTIELTIEKRRYFLQRITRAQSIDKMSKEYFCLDHTAIEMYNTLHGFIACLNFI